MKRAACVFLALAACRIVPSSASMSPSSEIAEKPLALERASEKDGLASAARQVTRALPAPAEGARTRLLEMYQTLARERDELGNELMATRAQCAALASELERESSARALVEAELAQARLRLEALGRENLELAQRLVTAQIRRLEAEKIVLETRLGVAGSEPKNP